MGASPPAPPRPPNLVVINLWLTPPRLCSSSWNESQINLASEVATLIEQLEGQVTKSASDNVQLRDFCTHLEGLLAAREARESGAGRDPADAGFVVNGRRVFAAGYE